MAKLNPLSALKEVAAQMMGIRRNLQSDLSATRKKIASLEIECETINKSTLSRSDTLEATLLNIDNPHEQLVERARQRILMVANKTAEGRDNGNGFITSYLSQTVSGKYSEYIFSRTASFSDGKPWETALVHHHEELKKSIRHIFEGISDDEWPDCSPIIGADALKRLAEIESQLAELRQHESELVAVADKEGVDIGQ
jgi:hypothetical protein